MFFSLGIEICDGPILGSLWEAAAMMAGLHGGRSLGTISLPSMYQHKLLKISVIFAIPASKFLSYYKQSELKNIGNITAQSQNLWL